MSAGERPAAGEPASATGGPPPATAPSPGRVRLARLAVAVIAVVVFSNALHRELQFDDESTIPRGQSVAAVLRRDHIPGTLQWRPVATGALALQGIAFGTDGRGFRAVSVGLHAAGSLLLLETALAWGFSLPVGAAAAILFAVHPAATEPVNWLNAQSEILALLFLLGALLALAPASRLRRPWALGLAGLGALLAVMSKEQAAGGAGVALLLGRCAPARSAESRWRGVRAALLWAAVVVLYLGLRRAALGAGLTAGRAGFAGNPLHDLPLLQRAPLGGYLLLHYFRLLLIPWPLQHAYGYRVFEPWAVGSGRWIAGALALLAVPAVAVGAWRRPHPLWIAAGGILCLLLPVSNILLPIGTVFAERLLYGPSAFFALGMGWLLLGARWGRGGAGAPAGRWRWLLVATLALPYGVLTLHRNPEWATVCRRFETNLARAPQSVALLIGGADCAFRRGDLTLARDRADRAVRIFPEFPEGLQTAARMHTALGDRAAADTLWERAVDAYAKAAARNTPGAPPDLDFLFLDYLKAMLQLEQPDRFSRAFGRWLEVSPGSPAERVRVVMQQGPGYDARLPGRIFDEWLARSGRSAEVLYAIGRAYLATGNATLEGAGVALLQECVARDPARTPALAVLGALAILHQDPAGADRYLAACLQADPVNVPCLSYRVEALIGLGRRREARETIARLQSLGVRVPSEVQARAQGEDSR